MTVKVDGPEIHIYNYYKENVCQTAMERNLDAFQELSIKLNKYIKHEK